MILEISLIVLSLLILTCGAEGLVRGSSSLALRAGLTPLTVGLTVVAFGTSSPELVVSLKAALTGQGNIAVGNVVGSNIFNIGVILGITALICPVGVKLQIIRIDAPIMIASAVGVALLLGDGQLGRMAAAALVLGLAAYTAMNIVIARRETSAEIGREYAEGVPGRSKSFWLDLAFLLGGLVILVLGSRLLVDNCVAVARTFGVSEAIIGLTIIAVGTSMPELATSVVAALRREPDIAIGNVVGSNIFNLLGILGISSLAAPLAAPGILWRDFAFMIGFSVLLLPLLWSGLRLRRMEGVILLAAYIGYLWILWPR